MRWGKGAPPEQDSGELLAARLTADEFLLLTPTGQAPATMDAMPDPDSICAHVVDITSGLCGVSITGPASTQLLSRITDLDLSPRVMPDPHLCPGTVLRGTRTAAAPGHPKHIRLSTLRGQRVRRIPMGNPDPRGSGNRRRPRGNRSDIRPEERGLNAEDAKHAKTLQNYLRRI